MTTVAYFAAAGSAGLADLLDVAEGWCELVVVNTGNRPWGPAEVAALTSLAHYVDVRDLDPDALATALRRYGVTGLVAFSDDLLPRVAAVAQALDLPYHDPVTAEALLRKDVQRHRLRAAGVETMRCATFDDPASLTAAVAHVGFPAVLKPVVGNASAHVTPVDDLASLHLACRRAGEDLNLPAIAGDAFGFGAAGTWQLEERLRDGAHPGGGWLGDYVSVESVALGAGRYRHFAVTDRLPLTWPLRETGMVSPTQLPADLLDRVLALAGAALAALGVEHGVTHTEIKLTPDGPRVIEVNGRLGGFVAGLLGRVNGEDPVRLALRAAVGDTTAGDHRDPTGYALVLVVQPPPDAVRLEQAADLAELRAVPGVSRVDTGVMPGEAVDYRTGTLGRVQTVWLAAATVTDLHTSYLRVCEVLAAGNRYRYRRPATDLEMAS
ncbi:carbamoyl-phosphate synthase large chain [Actinoplanes sp. SE50]|uniref:ATP-grasp domain-containing protein n=1 Tax=unclassified Actinoplanes TaxID=2626549 RepID=UPI00023EC86D|nr:MULTISPECIES: carbamoyl-phosphate synthase large chain [unclassified Actinoplanes]AEV87075.1 Carbamoyl-phosphate synthase large chain [Actinoplanes sp. SE50/110]ATO85473.1 carbamoyl-phosphate synthase large chain [Actinoplanes sp. SE50]SLM02885.1 carbamoyl-phosphate synthase large chain [Actinoplanes sp. SE50/110]